MNHLAAGAVGLCVVAIILCATSGCQSTGWKDRFDLARDIPWPTSREKRENPPERLASFWTDTVQTKPGEKPRRGFGGRIYFYNRKGGKPIDVDGQLVVYAFDEASRSPSDNRPTKRYVFPPEQFAKHASESELGPSYSVWLPWDESSGERKEISLIARFEPKVGSTIIGQQSLQQLPGPPAVEVAPIVTDGPRLASYNSDAGNGEHETRKRMMTTSIALPPRVGKIMPQANVRNDIPEGDWGKAAGRLPGVVETEAAATGAAFRYDPATRIEANVRSPYPVNSTSPRSRLSGFRLDKRLAPEGRVSPPTAFRGPWKPGPPEPPSGH